MKNLIKPIVLTLVLGMARHAAAQVPDTLRPSGLVPTVTLKGYAEAYYALDPGKPAGQDRPLLYNFGRENEFNLNLAFVEVAGAADRYRFKFTPAVGSYMQANYAAEPEGFRFVFEGNAGLRLLKERELWLDAGVLPSPFGYETALNHLQNTLTRSLSAENSPYYVAGARLTAPLGARTTASLFAINGWQNIRETNRAKSAAWQVTHQATGSLLLNYSGYLGDESRDPDTLGRAYRFFNDFYLNWKPSDRWNIVALFDVGVQNGRRQRVWHTANLTARYAIRSNVRIGGRVEYFADRDRVLLISLPQQAFLLGGSLNLDWGLTDRVMLRLESRYLAADEDNFTNRDGRPLNSYLYNTAALSAYF